MSVQEEAEIREWERKLRRGKEKKEGRKTKPRGRYLLGQWVEPDDSDSDLDSDSMFINAVVPKKETAPSYTHTTISSFLPMLATPDTSILFSVDSSDIILQVDLDSALPDSNTSFSSDRPQAISSIPPEILPKAIRFLTTWRLQEPRSALSIASVLVRRAEELDCTQLGRRIKWILKEYYEELEIERQREDAGPRIKEKVNDDQHDEKDPPPSQHNHGLDSSQLHRGCAACHIPRTRPSLVSNSIPTIQPIPIPTTHKATPTTRKMISTSTKVPISTKKPKSRPKPIVDLENIPPSQAPRRRPTAGKSRIPAPAPRVFGMHNA